MTSRLSLCRNFGGALAAVFALSMGYSGAVFAQEANSAPADRIETSGRMVTFGTAATTVSETKTPLAENHAESRETPPEPKGKTLVLKGGTTDSSNYEDALAIEAPQPELPAEHNEQGIKTSCCARFTIEEDGKFSVRLVSSTGSQEVDDLALATLRRWKFKPAQLNGKAVKSSRKIKIEFEIE